MKHISHSFIILFILAVLDFFLAFTVIMVSRYLLAGAFPRWYIIAFSSFLWALFGAITHKLDFWCYAREKYAYATIIIVDILVYVLCYLLWMAVFPERGITLAQLWPLPFLIVIECALYRIWHYLCHRIPYLYVEEIDRPLVERGIEKAVRYMDSNRKNADLAHIYEATDGMDKSSSRKWILKNSEQFSPDTLVLKQADFSLVEKCGFTPGLIICLQSFNRILHLNEFLTKVNGILPDGGTLVLIGETSSMRRHRIISEYPAIIGHLVVFADYFWSHIVKEISLSHKYSSFIARGGNINLPRVEVLGRIARAGFDICGDEIRKDFFIVSAIRAREAVKTKPHYGLFVRLPRQGKNGKPIGVFKLRTMYAYSEYIQDYTYKINGLEKGGKLKNDFRINLIGRFCRSHFIDEIPMLLNYLSGDLKLVGVRPLSRQYLSLYSPQMQQMHLSVKPGIFPPLYYDVPKPSTIEEIQESERRYIEQYIENPTRTDWKYFCGIMRNLLVHRAKSH